MVKSPIIYTHMWIVGLTIVDRCLLAGSKLHEIIKKEGPRLFFDWKSRLMTGKVHVPQIMSQMKSSVEI